MKIAYKLRFVPIMISAVFAFICFGNLSSASLPYQDPTADMLQEQSLQISIAENWFIISILLLVISVVYYLIVSKLYKR